VQGSKVTGVLRSAPKPRHGAEGDLGPLRLESCGVLIEVMAEHQRDRLPAGRPPWDTWNGVRVGLLAGGSIGVVAVAIAQSNLYWVALIPAALGGFIGYWSEARRRRDSTE
jgi:hypothetical protein